MKRKKRNQTLQGWLQDSAGPGVTELIASFSFFGIITDMEKNA